MERLFDNFPPYFSFSLAFWPTRCMWRSHKWSEWNNTIAVIPRPVPAEQKLHLEDHSPTKIDHFPQFYSFQFGREKCEFFSFLSSYVYMKSEKVRVGQKEGYCLPFQSPTTTESIKQKDFRRFWISRFVGAWTNRSWNDQYPGTTWYTLVPLRSEKSVHPYPDRSEPKTVSVA